MSQYIDRIKERIAPLKQQIVAHKVYSVINDIEDVRVFMQHHVFAVWDFMSLLKSLQNNLTCISIPWYPKGDAETRFLINEIVTGEESDVDLEGNRTSHYELYLSAMRQCEADTKQIEDFTHVLQATERFDKAFVAAGISPSVRSFIEYTFHIISGNQPHLQAAVFTFGREDLIPGMFHSMITDMGMTMPERISVFKYYLERHIEVDGDHHSELALKMTANLCGNNEKYWDEAEAAVVLSLQKRIALWDGIYEQIAQKKQLAV
ncbi:MAG: DUF3050 domain-containing protein [Flavipsychrobacter sp.]|nr:DUF3050 domain-containing protein [Flavipsychrobacter sp.]